MTETVVRDMLGKVRAGRIDEDRDGPFDLHSYARITESG